MEGSWILKFVVCDNESIAQSLICMDEENCGTLITHLLQVRNETLQEYKMKHSQYTTIITPTDENDQRAFVVDDAFLNGDWANTQGIQILEKLPEAFISLQEEE